MTDPSIWNLFQGAELRQGYVVAGGLRTRYVQAGQGPALLMLHGNGGHLEANLRAMARLMGDFTVYAIDMVAHGYTEAPPGRVGPQTYVDHVRAFLDVMGVERAHVAGVSLGARVALWTALVHPERVMKVIANTGLPLAPADETAAAEMRAAQQRSLAVTETLTRDNMLARLRGVIGDDRNIPDELIECRMRIYAQPGRAEIIKHLHFQNYEDMLTSANRPPWFGPGVLKAITAPVLVVWTEQNPGHDLDLARTAAALFPDGRLVVIPGAKHWPQWENPDAFVNAARDFLVAPAAPPAGPDRRAIRPA